MKQTIDSVLMNSDLSALWQQLQPSDRLRDIDLQLARQVAAYELDNGRSGNRPVANNPVAALFIASLCLSSALGKGQVCLPLNSSPLADLLPLLARDPGQLNSLWPDSVCWASWLSDCEGVWCIGIGAAETVDIETASGGYRGQPLVLETRALSNGQQMVRVYLARYYFYQQGLETHVRKRLQTPLPIDTAELKPVFESLFSAQQIPAQATATAVDWQAVAAATACLQRLTVITGGPGTGKTHTVTRLLAALLSSDPKLRIALAAPTGKAAARMTESIRNAKNAGDVPFAGQIPDTSFTLHRLLGWSPRGFRYGPQRQLPFDCVVVDESSMIDLSMMHQLIMAVPAEARLILLGDRDQLASVEAGSVLADLCNSGADCRPDQAFAERLKQLCGFDVPCEAAFSRSLPDNRQANSQADLFDLMPESAATSDEAVFNMANAVAELKVSRRFTADSGIGQLAAAVNAGQSQRALAVFGQFPMLLQLRLHETATESSISGLALWEQDLLSGYREYCELLSTPEGQQGGAALQAFGRFQALVAVRQGAFGVEYLNRHTEQLLTRYGLLKRPLDSVWYAGRPVMISRNDYDLGLFNGDIGVTVQNPDGGLRVAFESRDGDIRYLLPSRLPSHETSFVMTVHKSQGSEFEQVMLLLPEQWQPVITRELVYTAITRARQSFILLTSPAVWQRGLGQRVERASGLRDALWDRPLA